LDNNINSENVLFINFNYTSTLDLYTENKHNKRIIYIHGELKNSENPIIFGYGDEIDERFVTLEKENDNNYYTNIKSFKYSKTNNYREILKYINFGDYQILIMGHSCGLSDRTLLNTLFEHDNCKSIKIFYYIDKNGEDNYLDTYMNISRNFKNKQKMREIVVPKELSEPYINLQHA
jgi:hypothetical protein